MDTKKIEAFLTTIELGSMNKAAEKLNYTQTGLLYMIKTLEQELGTKLLIRTPQGVSLTKAGDKLLPIMKSTLSSQNLLMETAQEISSSQNNTVFIAAYPAFTRFQMPAVINKFIAEQPDINIDIRIGSESELLDWLSKGIVDLAIGEPSEKNDLNWMPLIDDEIFVAIPQNIDNEFSSPVNIESLIDYPVAFSGSNPFTNTLDDLTPKQNFSFSRVKVTSLDSSIPLSMLENQNGIMFLSHLYADFCPENVNMYPLIPSVKREIGILTNKKSKLPSHVLSFIEYLQKYA